MNHFNHINAPTEEHSTSKHPKNWLGCIKLHDEHEEDILQHLRCYPNELRFIPYEFQTKRMVEVVIGDFKLPFNGHDQNYQLMGFVNTKLLSPEEWMQILDYNLLDLIAYVPRDYAPIHPRLCYMKAIDDTDTFNEYIQSWLNNEVDLSDIESAMRKLNRSIKETRSYRTWSLMINE